MLYGDSSSTMFPSRIGLRIDDNILLLNAKMSENSVRLSASTLDPSLCSIVHSPSEDSKDVKPGVSVFFKIPSGSPVRRLIRTYPAILLKDPAGEQIRVISISKPVSLLDLSTYGDAPRLAFPSSPAPAPFKIPLGKDAISQAKATYEKILAKMDKAESKMDKAEAKGGLSPFVAKQLLELARSKGEFCPIVAEEFSTGNTAAMPCGHLFASAGLTESFKKQPGKCPTCRYAGHPTYV